MDQIPPPPSLDLSNLKEITGGDVELEKVLFATFIASAEQNISMLESLCDGQSPEQWKEYAHSLKGEAANLGAGALSLLGQKAQFGFEAAPEEKKALLEEIKKEMALLIPYLKQFTDP